jgi:hypothetical protein
MKIRLMGDLGAIEVQSRRNKAQVRVDLGAIKALLSNK